MKKKLFFEIEQTDIEGTYILHASNEIEENLKETLDSANENLEVPVTKAKILTGVLNISHWEWLNSKTTNLEDDEKDEK